MPPVLSLVTAGVALYAIAASGEPWTGAIPAAIALASVVGSYLLWRRRGRRWHDPVVILACLPGIAAGVWIAVGGLATGVERTDGERLLLEVLPGVALVGLLCTLVSYYGRHHPE
jgi:hypothetical protein